MTGMLRFVQRTNQLQEMPELMQWIWSTAHKFTARLLQYASELTVASTAFIHELCLLSASIRDKASEKTGHAELIFVH
jgi:hypothetical protein